MPTKDLKNQIKNSEELCELFNTIYNLFKDYDLNLISNSTLENELKDILNNITDKTDGLNNIIDGYYVIENLISYFIFGVYSAQHIMDLCKGYADFYSICWEQLCIRFRCTNLK